MNIKTTRFGEIEINDDKIIEFEQGIPGFDEEKQFVIIPYDEKSPFLFMQSVKQEDLAFLIINPFLIFADYEFEIDDASIEDLTVKQSEDLLIYTIITMNEGDIKKMTTSDLDIKIQEVKQPDMDATLVAENIAAQLERRIAFRRAMKQSVTRTMRMGAKGIKVQVGGRLGGAEIARSEGYREGSIPLHTLRADIDYGTAEAHTTYGRIGVKVWIYKGEVLPTSKEPVVQPEGGKK